MQNPKLALVQSAIGVPIDNHPVPVSNWLNGKILEAEHGRVKMEYPARPEMNNGLGIVQGGILVAIADNTIAYTVFTLGLENHLNTVSFHVEYHAPAIVGQPIVAEGFITREGKNIVFTECMLRDIEGKLLVKSTSSLLVRYGK